MPEAEIRQQVFSSMHDHLIHLLLKIDDGEHLNRNLKKAKKEAVGMLYIDSGLTNTEPVIGKERILEWSLEFFLMYVSIKLAVENIFLWNMVLDIHFQKRRKEMVPLCNKNQC